MMTEQAETKLRKKVRLLAKFNSPCYFSYLTGCDDIHEGDTIFHIGSHMNWHRKCEPKGLEL